MARADTVPRPEKEKAVPMASQPLNLNVTKEVRHVARVDTVPSPRPKKESPGALPMASQPFMAEQTAPEQQHFDFPNPKC